MPNYANFSPEYIGQLEGEVASKVDEANALRTENRQLREENNRLTDLTRMLLSSQAFAGFLQELNQSGVPEPPKQQPRQERISSQAQPQSTRKDVNPHEAARRLQAQQPQIGMALVPETNVDLSLFDTPSWNSTIPTTDFHVFAVTEVPQGPVLDLEPCTGKVETPCVLSSETIKMVPCLPELPPQYQITTGKPAEKSTSGSDQSASNDGPTVLSDRLIALAKHPLNPKNSTEIKTVAMDGQAGSWESLQHMCRMLDMTTKRLAAMVPGVE
jgi:ribonuclease Z